jgi:hypothetical protein
MADPKDVIVETIVKTVEEKAPEVANIVKEVEEVLAGKSCSCLVFGWKVVVTKSSPKSENVLKVE